MIRFIGILLILSFNVVNGQLMYVEIGQTISSFDYQNSSGGTLVNLQSKNASYLNAGYQVQLPGDKMNIIIGGVLTNYAAIASDALLDSFFEWETTYVGIQTGISY